MRLPRIIMGCGHSTFNLMEEGMACGGLKRRVSEKDLLNDNHDPSTKLLLKVGPNHDRNASSDSVVMTKECVEGEKGERGVSKCERGTEKEERDGMDDDECERGGDDDFGRGISDFDGGLAGSPSFREYCVDSESDQDVVNRGRCNGEGTEKKTQGTDKVVVNEEFCVFPGAKRLEKKESRGRKFTRVFPTMHRPKNLWPKTTSHSRNNRHIATDKSPNKEI